MSQDAKPIEVTYSMNWKVFLRDLYYAFRHTYSVLLALGLILGFLWLILTIVEYANVDTHQRQTVSIRGSSPLKISGIVPATSVNIIQANGESKRLSEPVFLELRADIPLTLRGGINIEHEPLPERTFMQEFWRCGEITGIATMTIGFGDVVPATAAGKWICVIQAIVGMLILGVIVGIVSHAIGLQLQRLT